MAVDNLKYNMDYMSSNKRQQVISSIEDSVNGTKELLTNLLEWARSQTQTIEYSPNEDNILLPYTKDRIISMRAEQVKELGERVDN